MLSADGQVRLPRERPVKGGYVTSLGAFTPVGINVPQTMGSVLSRLQWFDDLDLFGVSGAPVSGARVRLSDVENATERYAAMGRLALAECRDEPNPPREPSPLFLATSATRDLPCDADTLLAHLLDGDEETPQKGAALDRRGSRVFTGGRMGALDALATALEWMSSVRTPACYVGGVDSLLDPVRLQELLDEGRLQDGTGTEGFVPGEAAVFLKLEARSSSNAPTPVLAVKRRV